jgi:A/G-specific adenine glycosylase
MKRTPAPRPPSVPHTPTLTPDQALEFRRRLGAWYGHHARRMPWRGAVDPYRIWVSEIMLQQTRVAAMTVHYERFLRLFPTIPALARAPEESVLAAWSGLGYYRRARMLHKAAQFLVQELDGVLPKTSAGLLTLPGIGEYTAAAIASIAFGESIAVVDGNVERVLLRVTGRPEDASSAARTLIAREAAALVPTISEEANANAPGDHNQAMMELGATICTPKSPLCLECPVYDLCRTRGEHPTPPRAKQLSQTVAYLFETRRRGTQAEVLLARRDPEASLMPGMYELPPLPVQAVADREPILRVRHSITRTNYYVEIYAAEGPSDKALRKAVPIAKSDLYWEPVQRLGQVPLTGLARKAIARLNVLSVGGLTTPAQRREFLRGT